MAIESQSFTLSVFSLIAIQIALAGEAHKVWGE